MLPAHRPYLLSMNIVELATVIRTGMMDLLDSDPDIIDKNAIRQAGVDAGMDWLAKQKHDHALIHLEKMVRMLAVVEDAVYADAVMAED